MVKVREARCAAVHGVAKVGPDGETEQQRTITVHILSIHILILDPLYLGGSS